jgi:hypothetical protein
MKQNYTTIKQTLTGALTGSKALILGLALVCGKMHAQQVTYSFTTGGNTGMNGPSQAQINAAYLGTTLQGSVNVSGGIQSFTIPATGPYRIIAAGAGGGDANQYGGRGRIVQGDIILTQGTVIQVLVGQKGGNNDISSGGGGGSYVVDNLNSPIIIGGGGGGYLDPNGVNGPEPDSDANYTTGGQNSNDGTGFGGTNGSGGTGTNDGWGGGGGGMTSDGTDASYCSPTGGKCFVNGGQGGNTCNDVVGGFGGGGGTHGNSGGGGGGGGYSGGGGSSQNQNNAVGGGGGSYQSNSMTNLVDGGLNTGDGYVTIMKLYGVAVSQSVAISCFGQSVAILTGSVGGGVPPYTYTWMPVGGNTSVAVNLPAGVYTIAVTDASNAVTQTAYTVTQPGLLSGTVSNVNNATCYQGINGSAHLGVTGGVLPYQYAWIPNGGTAPTAFGLSAGVYTVYVQDANGCQTTNTVAISQGSLSLVASSSSPSVCQGSSVTLFGNGVSTYTWTGGVTNGTPFTPSVTTTYTVAGTNTVNGCTNTVAITVSVVPSPVVEISGATTVCPGQMLTLFGSGANSYTWMPGGATGFAANFNPQNTTTYSLTGSTSGCPSANTATATITVLTCVGIEEFANALGSISVYPNPTTGEFTVESGSSFAKTIEVMDVTGRSVLVENSSDAKVSLNISALNSGVYILRIKSESAQKVLKLVKD